MTCRVGDWYRSSHEGSYLAIGSMTILVLDDLDSDSYTWGTVITDEAGEAIGWSSSGSDPMFQVNPGWHLEQIKRRAAPYWGERAFDHLFQTPLGEGFLYTIVPDTKEQDAEPE